MFICDDCLREGYANDPTFMRSRGPCEVCKYVASCSDIHHSALVAKPRDDRDVRIAALEAENARLREALENEREACILDFLAASNAAPAKHAQRDVVRVGIDTVRKRAALAPAADALESLEPEDTTGEKT